MNKSNKVVIQKMARKISPREAKVFSELLSLGYTQKSIANLAGVSQPTISRILRSDTSKEMPKQATITMKGGKKH